MLRRMVRPRRPLLGAAMIGGTAYAAGRSRVRGHLREESQEERLAALENEQAQTAAMASPTASAAVMSGGEDIASKLTQLKRLLDQGILTADEFESAKQKLLAS